MAGIGHCPACGQRAEIINSRFGRICDSCAQREEQLEAQHQGGNTRSSSGLVVHRQPTAAPVSVDERTKYLEVIRGASKPMVDRIVARLVRERVFHVEFDRIIENERWFSLMDLRRIALMVDPKFESPAEPKQRRQTCPPKNRRQEQPPQSQQHPQLFPQEELSPTSLE